MLQKIDKPFVEEIIFSVLFKHPNYDCSVETDGEFVQHPTRNIEEIVEGIRAVDYAEVFFGEAQDDGRYLRKSFITFENCNDHVEIVSDYSMSLEETIKPSLKLWEDVTEPINWGGV